MPAELRAKENTHSEMANKCTTLRAFDEHARLFTAHFTTG